MAKRARLVKQISQNGKTCKISATYKIGVSETVEKGTVEDVGNLGELGKLLLAVEGVTGVAISAYDAVVVKGEAFSWDEVLPEVENIIKAIYTNDVQLLYALDEISHE